MNIQGVVESFLERKTTPTFGWSNIGSDTSHMLRIALYENVLVLVD